MGERVPESGFKFGWSDGQSESGGGSAGAMGDEVSQVGRGQVVKGFGSQEEEDFEIDTLFDGEPEESEENRSDVFMRPGLSEKARSSRFGPFGVYGGTER